MYSKHQARALIRNEIRACTEIMEVVDKAVVAANEWKSGDYFESKNKRLAILDSSMFEDFYVDVAGCLAQFGHAKYTQIVGMVSGFITNMSPKEAIRTTGELIALAAIVDLIDVIPAADSRTGSMELVSRIQLEPKTLELINQYQYLPPMIVPPMPVKSNTGSGYLSIEWDSLILKKNHHELDICLDSINRFNSVAFALDDRVIRNIRDNRKHLDSAKSDESADEFKARVDSFLKMERESMKVFAMLINEGNRFYMTHKYDKRGRTYCQGYHVSYQGNTYRKAILELADKEFISIEE
jgi:hypothetical protein